MFEMPPSLRWEVDVPLLTNPRYLRGMLLIAGLSGLLPSVLIVPLLWVQGERAAVVVILRLLIVLAAALLLSLLLAMGLFFGNRLRFRFTINSDGMVQEVIDCRARAANRLAQLGGWLLGNLSTVAAGQLAQGQEQQRLAWSGAFRLEPRPFPRCWQRGPFVFANHRRPLLEVYATDANRQQVAALIQHYMALHHPERRLAPGGALLPALWHTLAVLLACLLVGLAGPGQPADPLAAMLLLAFALATIWMLPPFAWVVLLLCGLTLVLSLAEIIAAPRFSGDRILMLSLQLLGLSYLSWFSLRVLRGRWLPMLLRDDSDRGEG